MNLKTAVHRRGRKGRGGNGVSRDGQIYRPTRKNKRLANYVGHRIGECEFYAKRLNYVESSASSAVQMLFLG